MSFFESVVNIGKGIKDFIGSDTVKTIADGAKTVLDYMKEIPVYHFHHQLIIFYFS